MKNALKALSYGNRKKSTKLCSALMFCFSLCLHFIKVWVAWLWEIRYHHRARRCIKIRTMQTGQYRDGAALRVGRVRVVEQEMRAKLGSVEGFSLRAWPSLHFVELLIRQAGLGRDELSGRSQGIHGRRCESSSTWLGREEHSVEREKEGRSGREASRKTPDLVFLKPSSYIANAWSNMGSFIMDKPLAPACKVYHVHCKEVKDWAVFARNMVTTFGHALACAIVVNVGCREGLLQNGPEACGAQTLRGNTDQDSSAQACYGLSPAEVFQFRELQMQTSQRSERMGLPFFNLMIN